MKFLFVPEYGEAGQATPSKLFPYKPESHHIVYNKYNDR